MAFFFTMANDTLWPNRSRMLSMLYRIMVGLQQKGQGHRELPSIAGEAR